MNVKIDHEIGYFLRERLQKYILEEYLPHIERKVIGPLPPHGDLFQKSVIFTFGKNESICQVDADQEGILKFAFIFKDPELNPNKSEDFWGMGHLLTEKMNEKQRIYLLNEFLPAFKRQTTDRDSALEVFYKLPQIFGYESLEFQSDGYFIYVNCQPGDVPFPKGYRIYGMTFTPEGDNENPANLLIYGPGEISKL